MHFAGAPPGKKDDVVDALLSDGDGDWDVELEVEVEEVGVCDWVDVVDLVD